MVYAGGGIEPCETDADAAARELSEELSLVALELGPCIWTRRHIGTFRGQPFDQVERIYLARTHSFAARPRAALSTPEHRADDIRWWTLEELEASREVFAPRDLPLRFRLLLDAGPPESPLSVGL